MDTRADRRRIATAYCKLMGVTIDVFTMGGLGSPIKYYPVVLNLHSNFYQMSLPITNTRYKAIRFAVLWLIRHINDTVLNKTTTGE